MIKSPFVSRRRYERLLQEHDDDLWMLMRAKSFMDPLQRGEVPTKRHSRDTRERIDAYLKRPAVRETEGERRRLRGQPRPVWKAVR